jgi:hypothetical protein
MRRGIKFVFGLGCLTSVLGPILALLLYPKAEWLFGMALIGPAILWMNHRLAKDPTPQALADEVERLLTGNYGGWDVDDFQMRSIRDPVLRDLYRRTFSIGARPEEWVGLDEERKDQLRKIIAELRSL